MKKMFHGTVDAFLSSIQQKGIIPHAENSWKFKFPGGDEIRDVEKTNGVFVTSEERRAIEYAETRVRYYAAKPGTVFSMFDVPNMTFVKDKDVPVMTVKPIVLVLTIPDDLEHRLEDDDRDPYHAYKFQGTIPPSCITQIKRLSTKLKETDTSHMSMNSDVRVREMLAELLGDTSLVA